MYLSVVGEIVWQFYAEGREKATNQSFSKQDVTQHARMAFANYMRQLYYNNKQLNDGDEYYFSSPILSIMRFPLTDPNAVGKRRADMSNFDLYRLPKNSHFTNVYLVGCDSDGISISQVQPSEENFYLTPEYNFFKFYVPKGRGIDTYHVPPCVKNVDIETTYDNDNVDITLDIAFEVANSVLGVILKIPGFVNWSIDNPYSKPQMVLKNKLQEQQTTLPTGQ
jgi:hypothetical protein